jgi:hypothetical protein
MPHRAGTKGLRGLRPLARPKTPSGDVWSALSMIEALKEGDASDVSQYKSVV